MNKTLPSLYKWVNNIQSKWANKPKYIPLTQIELLSIIDESSIEYQIIPTRTDNISQIFGIDSIVKEFANEARLNMLRVPLGHWICEYSFSEFIENTIRLTIGKDEATQQVFRRLECDILSDKTKLQITFEWDCWATIKRLLHITKWFPIKTKTKTIDCVVLYPYCKVSLPHNRHFFHCK